MSLVLQDRVRETTNTTGTGTFTLLGAVTGYQSFSVIGNGNTCFYACADQGGPNWEVGLGTYSSGTLARTTVLSSSNSGSLVNFTAGTKDVFVTQPSEKAVYLDGSGNITPSSVGPLTVSSLTDSGLTSGRVTYAGTAGLLQDSANLTFNGTILTANTLNLTNALTTAYGGTGLTSFTAGDLPYYSTGTALSKLAIGTNGYILQSNGSAPTWVIASSVIGGAGGSNTQVQYNSSGSLAGSANLTFNGTTLTTANDASISGLTVGKGSGSVATATAFGYQALNANTTGGNLAIGYQAMALNTTGDANTAIGRYQPLYANTTGNQNVAVGDQALVGNTTGGNNIGIGKLAVSSNTTGNSNVGIGTNALNSNTTASNNTAVGYQAGYTNSTGLYNTFMGYQAGYASTVSYNTCIGYQSGQSITSGGSNVLLGATSGVNLTTGGSNMYLGYTTASSGSVSNEIVINNSGATGKGTNTGFISPNGGGVYQGNNSTLWSITSDQRLKKNIVDNTDGLNKITAIQVRNFEYRTKDEVIELEPQNAIDIKGVQLGAIAQELQAILPDCVKTESTGVMSVDASNLTWYLINAVKELNAKITALENK